MKKLLIILILLVPLCFAQEEIIYSDTADLVVTISSDLSLRAIKTDATIDYLTAQINLYPQSTWRQTIKDVSILPSPSSTDPIIFHWINPQNQLSYSIESQIRTNSNIKQIKNQIPYPYEYKDELEFTKAASIIDINDDIIKQASDLAEGEDDLYYVVFKLANWTHNNIEYDLNTLTADANQKSSWVLENRFGVCDEMTNLFISMCRSLGIPARFVTGISYTNSKLFDEPWGMHGWAEVYFPDVGWVPFDITYKELGYIDSGHVKFGDSFDSNKSTTEYEWTSYGYKLDSDGFNIDTKVKDIGNQKHDPIKFKISTFDDIVDFGSYMVISVAIENTADFYVTSEFRVISTKEIEIEAPDRFISLLPGELKKEYYIVKVPRDLSQRYIYSFPIEVKNSLNTTAETILKAAEDETYYSRNDLLDLLDFREKKATQYIKHNFSCEFPSLVLETQEFDIACSIKNKGNVPINYHICLNQTCDQGNILLNQVSESDFILSFKERGKKTFKIEYFIEDEPYVELFEIDVIDAPKIELNGFEHPQNIDYGDSYNLKFNIDKLSISDPINVKLILKHQNLDYSWDFKELTTDQPMIVNMNSQHMNFDENKYKLTVEYEDILGNKYQDEANFVVMLNEPSFFQKIIIWLNDILN